MPRAVRPLNLGAPRLGPRTFCISVVNSFGGKFVWIKNNLNLKLIL